MRSVAFGDCSADIQFFFTAPMRAFFSLIGGFDSQFLGSKTTHEL
jgi:hypothetical protein